MLLTGGSGFIGTNLTDLLLECGADVVNADVRPPLAATHAGMWRRCDVGSEPQLRRLVEESDPELVVHLAARTDTTSTVVEDYSINHVGTSNLVRALTTASRPERFVLVSSQFVLAPGAAFTTETDYAPHTAYGHSKVAAERWLRDKSPELIWTIVRPTNVWGPWHLEPAWLVVVAAEMVAINSGLGYLIIDARNAGTRYDLVVAGMALIGLIGFGLDVVMRRLETLDEVRWRYDGTR